MTTMELGGRPRAVLPGGGRYTEPPEPGTVMGPNGWGELVVVLGTVDGLTLFSYARTDDIQFAEQRIRAEPIAPPLFRGPGWGRR